MPKKHIDLSHYAPLCRFLLVMSLHLLLITLHRFMHMIFYINSNLLKKKGIMTYANGDRFDGKFNNDQREGKGINFVMVIRC